MKEEIIILRLKGRFISSNNRKVYETVEQVLRGRLCYPRLLFDFKEVTRIDCAGLGTLVKLSTDILSRGGRLAIINMSKNIRDVTVMTQLSCVLECFKSENDAITTLLGYNERNCAFDRTRKASVSHQDYLK